MARTRHEPFEEAPSRRAVPRVALTMPMTLELEDGRVLPCGSRDLGLGGVCVRSAEPLPLDAIRGVRIGLPDGVLTLRARGAWQRPLESEGGVLSGLAFVDPGLREREMLDVLFRRQVRALTRFLAESTVLAPLDFDDAMDLTRRTRHCHFAVGQRIYDAGASGGETSVFVVVGGRVDLELPRPGGEPVGAGTLRYGDVFGGLPVVTGLPHPETAVVRELAQLVEIDEASYVSLAHERPMLARALEHAGIRRLHADLRAALGSR